MEASHFSIVGRETGKWMMLVSELAVRSFSGMIDELYSHGNVVSFSGEILDLS
jgi:hypothetical protein